MNSHTEYEKKMIEYYRKCFISEFSKICIFFLIFLLLGLIPEYLIALFALIILRGNGGGLHFNHYISCLIVSFAFLYISIILSIYVVPSRPGMFISLPLCILIGYHLVPITSSNRPPATSEQVTKSKRCTLIVLLAFSLLICICPGTKFIYICYWTIILHILQLIIAHIKEVKRNV